MKSVFLFPGQGSQSVGMLKALADESPLVMETFSQASDVLGYDLWSICQQGPEEQLNSTAITQPAMLTADIATWRVWLANGGAKPDIMAGHSLGEYAALVAAGCIGFEDAVRLVERRGQLMQQAVPEGEGAMAAVLGLEEDALSSLCEQQAEGQVVSCANINAPGQIVIAGNREAVERTCDAARDAGARRALTLPVSVPSHCALMSSAARSLESSLADTDMQMPAIPVLHNADVEVQSSVGEIQSVLARQLWQPVQWTKTIQKLVEQGASQFYECGPGKVLMGLNRRIDRSAATTALIDLDSINNAIGSQTA